MKLPTKEESRTFVAVIGVGLIGLGLADLLLDIKFWNDSKWIALYDLMLKYLGRYSVGIFFILAGSALLVHIYINQGKK